MKRNLTAAVPLAALLALGVAAVGFTGCGHHRPDPARMEKMVTHQVDDTLDDLKATPEQRQKVTAVKDRLLAQARALRGDRQATVKEAVGLWEASSFDRNRALAMVDARLDAMRAMAHAAVDAAAELHETLTPEQRAQVTRRLRRHAEE